MKKINKIAYPQGQADLYRESYDINKWIQTFQNIHLYVNQGADPKEVYKNLTKNWDEMEKNDFNHWMKYYQGNNHSAYKTAQFMPSPSPPYIEMGPGVLLPNKSLDTSRADDLKPNIKLPEEDDPQFKINKKIKGIISRLMAAEKLATDPEVQRELSRRLDVSLHKWLEELQRVKRLVQVAPIKHAQSTILEDIIIKEANILASKGFPKVAQELIKIAQVASPAPPATPPAGAAPASPPKAPPMPEPSAPPPAANAPSLPGVPDSLPALPSAPAAVGAPLPAPGPAPSNKPSPAANKPGADALDLFVNRMNPQLKDKNEIVDMIDGDPLAEIFVYENSAGVSGDHLVDDSNELISFAQEMPLGMPPAPTSMAPMAPEAIPAAAPAPAQPPAMMPAPTPEIEVSEDQDQFAETLVHKKTDDLLEQALSGITVTDVIERLDTLVNLFRTREIPRQLAIIDLMMDQLNLSSFFPGLAEASSKSLESNQYALSRIEEVLSKLKGSIKNPKDKELDLVGTGTLGQIPQNVDAESVRSSLQNQELKEKTRKQQRKQEELAKSEPTPDIEVTEDLAQPVALPPEQPMAPMQQPPAPVPAPIR